MLAEENDQTAHAEDAEADRDEPVSPAFGDREPFDHASARPLVQLDRAESKINRCDHRADDDHEPAAPESNRAVAELAPRFAGGRHRILPGEARSRLDQNARFAAG